MRWLARLEGSHVVPSSVDRYNPRKSVPAKTVPKESTARDQMVGESCEPPLCVHVNPPFVEQSTLRSSVPAKMSPRGLEAKLRIRDVRERFTGSQYVV